MEDNRKYQAEEDHLMDDMFRNSLSGKSIEPPPDLWKSISRKLLWKEIAHFNFTNFSKPLLISGAAAVVLITTMIFVLIRPEHLPEPQTCSTPVPENAQLSSSSSSRNHPAVPTNRSVSQPIPSATPGYTPLITFNTKYHQKNQVMNTATGAPVIVETESQTFLLQKETDQNTKATYTYLNSLEGPDLLSGIGTDTLTIIVPGKLPLNVLKEKIPTPNFFSASLGVAPEMAFYKTSYSYTEMNFWVNLNATYHISRFSIGTGISYGQVNDDGIYRVEYKAKDSVGYFNDVISFTVNPENPSEISFITQVRNVYDSVSHIADDRTRNRYTYIKIPLLLGYRLVETQHFGLDIIAGPAVSFLIGSKEASPVIDYPNARIIRIEDETPSRIQTSWQIWVALHLDYQINKKLSVFAEPSYTYSFKVYGQNGEGVTGNPYAIGLGIGVKYIFGSQTK